jgi:peptide/nickel transport system permease protein
VVLTLMVLAAVFAGQLSPFDPNSIDNGPRRCRIGTARRCRRAFKINRCAGDIALGTDEVGRDLLSRLLFGARISLTVGLFAVIMEVLIGTTLGAIAGYYGGWLDYALMRLTDVFLSIPLLPLLLVLTAIVAATSTKAALSFGSSSSSSGRSHGPVSLAWCGPRS